MSELKNDNYPLIFGVMGNRNRGKSFLFQVLS